MAAAEPHEMVTVEVPAGAARVIGDHLHEVARDYERDGTHDEHFLGMLAQVAASLHEAGWKEAR